MRNSKDYLSERVNEYKKLYKEFIYLVNVDNNSRDYSQIDLLSDKMAAIKWELEDEEYEYMNGWEFGYKYAYNEFVMEGKEEGIKERKEDIQNEKE